MKYTFLLRSASIFIFALLFFGAAGSAYAVDRCWDGGGSTNNWTEDANWSGDTEPGSGDVAVFDNGTCSGTPNKNATIDADELIVGGVNMVSYSGTLSLGSNSFGATAFTQASGTIDLDTGLFLLIGDFTRTGGTFIADSSTFAIALCNCTFSGSTTFNNLLLGTTGGQNTADIASGTTFTVTGTLELDGSSDANDALNGPGGISAQGDISVIGEGIREGGSVVITINGTGTQTLDGEGDTNTRIPNITIDKSSGTLSITDTIVVAGDWIYSQGTISAGSSTVIFLASDSSIDGSHTLANATIMTTTGQQTKDITSGTTLTLTGNLTIDGSSDANDVFNGPGSIAVQGNVSIVGEGIPGDAIIAVTGTGTQTLDGEADTDTRIPAFTINKSTGTLNITDTIVAMNDWTYSQGTVSPGSSTIIFNVGEGTITGSHTLGTVTFRTDNGMNTRDIASGTTLTATGTLTIDATTDNNDTFNGPGTLNAQGNVTFVSNGINGDVPITLSGSSNQTFTTTGTTLTSGTITINKSSGTVTLGAALTLDGTGQDLVISSGILDMSTYALTVDDVVTLNGGLLQGSGNFTASNGNMTIGTTGWWVNNSTGDIDAEGGDTITNNGYVRWDGASAGCGGTDGIALTRNGSGAVNLAGSGRWRVYDITIGTTGIYAASPALTIYSSSITGTQTGITNNGTCPSERTWIGSGNYNTAANWSGTAVPGSTQLAIFDATSTSNMTVDVDPNDNGFQINLGYSGTITQTNGVDLTLDDQGWEQNAGTFTGGNNTSDMNLNNGGVFALTNGVFTAPAGTITTFGDWTVSGGTFNANSGTIDFDNANITINPLSETYNNIEFSGNGVIYDITTGKTLNVDGTLLVNATNTFLNGPGDINLQGDITHNGNNGMTGDLIITVNGTGTQTWSGGVNGSAVPGISVDKTLGTFVIEDSVGVGEGGWEHVQGNIDATTGQSEFYLSTFNADTAFTGNTTFYDVTKSDNCAYTTISSGTTITVANDLTLSGNCGALVNGPGALEVQGDISMSSNNGGASVSITLSGSNNQLITDTTGSFPEGTLTINKPSGTVTLGTALNLSGSGQDLTITDGTLANSSYALTVNDAFTINDTFTQGTGNVSATSYTVGASANWTNTSTGDVTVGTGGVTNSGTITLGDINTCGGGNNIAITSSSGGNQRAWSGSGTFNIYDTTIQDQGGSAAITAYSSQSVSGNGGNWTFDNVCPSVEVQGIRLRGGGLKIRGGTKVL